MKKKEVIALMILAMTLAFGGCGNNAPNIEESKEVEAINSSVVATNEETKESENVKINETNPSIASSVEETEEESTKVEEPSYELVLEDKGSYYKVLREGVSALRAAKANAIDEFDINEESSYVNQTIEVSEPIKFYLGNGNIVGVIKENAQLYLNKKSANWTSFNFVNGGSVYYIPNEALELVATKVVEDEAPTMVASNNNDVPSISASTGSVNTQTTTKEESSNSSNEGENKSSSEVVESYVPESTPEPTPTPVVEEPVVMVEENQSGGSSYTPEDVMGILDSTLRNGGIGYIPDAMTPEQLEKYGPTGGAGYAESYIPYNRAQDASNNILDFYNSIDSHYFYLEIVSSDENGVTIRGYY